jgi:hypothetical protein
MTEQGLVTICYCLLGFVTILFFGAIYIGFELLMEIKNKGNSLKELN